MDNPRRRGPSPSRTGVDANPLSTQRAHLLEALQNVDEPVTATQMADRLGLHVNTAREHLDALVDRDLAVRGRAASAGRGRPAHTYLAARQTEHDSRVRDYAGLATALAGHIARTSTDPAADALAVGKAWAAELLASSTPTPPGRRAGGASAVAARRDVVALLEGLGFAPDADADARTVALRQCPLLDAANRHPDIICGVHLGIVQGALHLSGADPLQAGLEPFAEPDACRLTLAKSR